MTRIRLPADSSPEDRLLDSRRRLITKAGCWEWQGATTKGGYGKVGIGDGKTALAHRMAYSLWKGEVPDDLLVCHKCDNPRCYNPDHLVLGTTKTNAEDMVTKNRSTSGEKHPSHKLTEQQVSEIRSKLVQGNTLESLADEYAVSVSLISAIGLRRRWRHEARE